MLDRNNVDEKLKDDVWLLNDLEQRFDFPKGAFWNLYFEDDFSFFVKFTAVFEFILAKSIAGRIFNPTLAKEDVDGIVRRLDLANLHTGKLKLAESFEILPKEDCKFIRAFAELRNKLAHNGSMILFDVEDFLGTMEEKDQRSWIKRFRAFDASGTQNEIFGEPIDLSLACKFPKAFIYAGVLNVLHSIDVNSNCIVVVNSGYKKYTAIYDFDDVRIL
jgi:hypothetical protein